MPQAFWRDCPNYVRGILKNCNDGPPPKHCVSICRRAGKREKSQMRGMKRRFRYCVGSAGVVLAALCVVFTPAFAQNLPTTGGKVPGRLSLLYEYPLDVRMIYTNGRAHPKDPDPTFNGDSTAHWEGDTLVVDVLAIDTRLRNITGNGATGWFPSDQEHVVERFSRP